MVFFYLEKTQTSLNQITTCHGVGFHLTLLEFLWVMLSTWQRMANLKFQRYLIQIWLDLIKICGLNLFKEVNALCWILAVGTGVGVIYGLDYSGVFDSEPYPIVSSAFYGGFHRLAWGVALGWVVFACSRGYGGIKTFYSLIIWLNFELKSDQKIQVSSMIS